MAALTLMARAREILQRRAGVSALVIVPLAAAAPACADTVFVLNTTANGNNYISGSSGGAFGSGPLGHASSSLGGGGTAVQMLGDTFTNKPTGSYLTSDMAFYSVDGVTTGPPSATANIIFQWQGTFTPDSTVDQTDALWLITSIVPVISPNDGGGSVVWSLDANISDADNTLVDETVSSSDVGNSFLQPFALGGTPESWVVTLDVQWTFPTTLDSNNHVIVQNPGDELNLSPEIDMTVLPGAEGAPAVPLPAAVWSGGTLLGVWMMGAFVRKLRMRHVM